MIIRRRDPSNELRRMQENMDQLWQSFAPVRAGAEQREGRAAPLDVIQDGEDIVVQASLPGVDPKHINVSIESDVLTIRGNASGHVERQSGNYLMRERHTGSFHRSLRLPDSLDLEKAHSRYDNGVLTITLPKLEARQARQLEVSVGGDAGDAEA